MAQTIESREVALMVEKETTLNKFTLNKVYLKVE